MSILSLSPLDLAIASILILILALLSHLERLGIARTILWSAVRMAIQLMAIGVVLKALFEDLHPAWMIVMASIMLGVSGREVSKRQKQRFQKGWSYGIGTGSMFFSSFIVTAVAIFIVIQPDPWYTPQYLIPLLGMMLGNTMTAVSLGMDRLIQDVARDRMTVEARLLAGESWQQAITPYAQDAVRTGLIPTINSMAAAGLVSLPGMMTGQILGGNPPMLAVGYQILVMFMIAAGAGFGTIFSVKMASRRLFDERHRLRLDRLHKP
ncbi:MAG: iron export ABC transporter permease subunit FetB [Magnetococcales bacterium]|nr:iron export ABC transporter permease subunit FetB [Magnetococcales bacterium]